MPILYCLAMQSFPVNKLLQVQILAAPILPASRTFLKPSVLYCVTSEPLNSSSSRLCIPMSLLYGLLPS